MDMFPQTSKMIKNRIEMFPHTDKCKNNTKDIKMSLSGQIVSGKLSIKN